MKYMHYWNYQRARDCFYRKPPMDPMVKARASEHGITPYTYLISIFKTLSREQQHQLNILSPMIFNLVAYEYETRAETPIWHHWFLEDSLSEALRQAADHVSDMPVNKLDIPNDQGVRLWLAPNSAGWVREILMYMGGETGEMVLILTSICHRPNEIKPFGVSCIIPWSELRTVEEAWNYAKRNIRTDDPNAIEFLASSLILGLSTWLYFTSVEPERTILDDGDWARRYRKASKITGPGKNKALKDIGKRPPSFDVFRLKDLPTSPVDTPIDPHPTIDSTTGATISITKRASHTVRSHWRWQACGQRWSQHRLVLVRPHRRGDEAKITAYRFRG